MDTETVSYRELVEQISDGLYLVDRSRRILYWNRGAERISGFGRDQVVGQFCHDDILRHIDENGELLCHGECPLMKTIRDGRSREDLIYLHHRDGHRVPVQVKTSPLRDKAGEIIGAAEVFNDATPDSLLVSQLEELKQAAMTDALTDLPNRRYLEMALTSRLHELHLAGRDLALLIMDIDHFKAVNDRFGHSAGDEVLCLVARTLLRAARSRDDVGRWGGEEFVALVRCPPEQLAAVAERYRTLVAGSQLRDRKPPLGVTLSIGGTVAREHDTPESLVHRADEQLYRAKAEGRDRTELDLGHD